MDEKLNFRKRPVVIQAVQWTGENLREVICFTDGPPYARSTHASMKWEDYCYLVKSDGLKIYTLEGEMSADVGDWIIKGVKGEHYPCKPDVFELTYEPARAQLPSKGGEDAEVVAYRGKDPDGGEGFVGARWPDAFGEDCIVERLMTVAQHQRIMAALTPQSPNAELVELLRSKFPRIDPCQPVPLDEKAHCCEYTIYVERERLHRIIDAKLASLKP